VDLDVELDLDLDLDMNIDEDYFLSGGLGSGDRQVPEDFLVHV
jgi:hypothetical protein